MAQKRRGRGTGSTRQLASGRWQARFRGPDGLMRPAPVTFDTKLDADAWLKSQTSDVDRGMWQAPDAVGYGPAPTLKMYAENWLATRELKPTTRRRYRQLLDLHILPALGPARLDRISPATVRTWRAQLSADHPTRNAHAYSLLRTMYNTAYSDDLVKANPCRISGAGQSPARKQEVHGAELPQLATICENMHEKYTALVLLAAWCALRFGELVELRREDIDLQRMVVKVRRGATYIPQPGAPGRGQWHVLPPKSAAGIRDVSIPPHLLPVLEKHLKEYTGRGAHALLWTHPKRRKGSTGDIDPHLTRHALDWEYRRAREIAGRPDLRFHDLRHTGANLAAASGATIKELMLRLGHTTPRAAMIYQEAAQGRDKAIAEALSEIAAAEGNVIPLRKAGT